jgi:hypothetical protein
MKRARENRGPVFFSGVSAHSTDELPARDWSERLRQKSCVGLLQLILHRVWAGPAGDLSIRE